MQGESLIPLLTGNDRQWNRESVYYHYYEYPAEHAVKRHYGISTKTHKLIHFYHDVDEWELYDLVEDPNEMINVYNDAEYSKIQAQLKKDLSQLRKTYKDSEDLDQKFIQTYNDNQQN